MAVTIKDIAKIAGISYATVSRAINNHPEVSSKTREKVLKIVQENGYYPNAVARGLVNKRTKTVGVIIPDISNPHYPVIVKGVEDRAAREGYHIFLCNTDWNYQKENEYIGALIEKQVAGLVISPVSIESHKRIKNLKLNMPVVYLGSREKNEKLSFVTVDNVKAADIAAKFLIDLGHTNIAYVGGKKDSVSDMERLKGYKASMQKSGFEKNIKIIKGSGYTRESGYNSVNSIFKNNDIPTAIIAANDIIALGVIQAIRERELLVPDDISVIGFDDIDYASLPGINLTTISQPKYDMGTIAMDIILRKTTLKNNVSEKNTQIIFEPSLIKRGTCQRINK